MAPVGSWQASYKNYETGSLLPEMYGLINRKIFQQYWESMRDREQGTVSKGPRGTDHEQERDLGQGNMSKGP